MCAPRILNVCASRIFKCARLGLYVCRRRAPPWAFPRYARRNLMWAPRTFQCGRLGFLNARASDFKCVCCVSRILCVPQASTPMGFPKVCAPRISCAPRVITQMQWSVAQADMPPMEDVDDPEPRTEASQLPLARLPKNESPVFHTSGVWCMSVE